MKIQLFFVLAVLAVSSASVFAGSVMTTAPTITTGGKARTDNKAFVGVNMAFGDKMVPELVAGFRSMRSKESGNVTGGGVDVTFPISNGIGFDKIRVKALDGRRHLQGELGLGYSFMAKTPLFTGGAQGPFVALGVDYLWFTKATVWNAGVNTLGPYKKVSPETTVTCPAGYSLVGSVCESGVPG